jgi:uncharacterized protein (DUF1330 family)
LVAQYGGRYLAVGPVAEILEGDWRPEVAALIEFPGMQQLKAFWDSARFAEVKTLREGKAIFAALALNGV